MPEPVAHRWAQAGDTDSGRADRWLAAALIVIAFASFARTLLYGYVLDDTSIIRGNPLVQSWSGIATAWTHPFWLEDGPSRSGLYRPLLIAVFTAVWNAGHKFAFWFHLLAVGTHVLATWLVWRLLRPGVGRWAAFTAALWFSVHPVHVEAVANITNSSEVMVAVWTALLALAVRRAVIRTADDGQIAWAPAVGIAALYAAAACTKESGVVAPALAVVWAWGWQEPPAEGFPSRAMLRAIVHRWWRMIVTCLFVLVAIGGARMLVLGDAVSTPAMAAPGLEGISAWQRMWAMLFLGPRVLSLVFWPEGMSPHYGPELIDGHHGPSVEALVTIGLVALVTGLALRRARRGDTRPLAGLAWMFVAMIPASNLFTATGQILAERTLYGATVGAAMLVAWVVENAASRAARLTIAWRRAANAVVAALVVACAVRSLDMSLRYARMWETHDRLFGYLIQTQPDGYRGHWLMALRQRDQGDVGAALAEFARAYALYPHDRQLTIDYTNTLSAAHRAAEAAGMAAHLMDFADLRASASAVGLYLDTVDRAYGTDSARALARVLAAGVARPRTR